mmetsp:Transcript_3483/g.9097  ORF Transcript_3483/g.9097 Transcript_3483/m.9097 type:complete len:97 (-) Transcript_3483:246-536(-)
MTNKKRAGESGSPPPVAAEVQLSADGAKESGDREVSALVDVSATESPVGGPGRAAAGEAELPSHSAVMSLPPPANSVLSTNAPVISNATAHSAIDR